MAINPKIFKSYDVRGIYPEEINEEGGEAIGKAIGTFIKDDIVVGYDMRPSSLPLFEALVKGINSTSQKVIELGVCTTPMLNFAVAHKNFRGGVMITASHNPPQYNGFKLIGEKAVQFNKERGLKEIKELVLKNKIEKSLKAGQVEKYNILPEYVAWITKKISKVSSLKIVADAGNGVAGISAHSVFEKLGLEVKELYFKPDGTFPNHPANPVEEKNLKDLKKEVLETKANLGIAFDGDGDRAILIDEKGETVPSGFLLAAIASEELKGHRGEKIYYDLRFSKGVVEAIEKAGGVAVRMRVGNPYYKEKLILEGGLLGAEYSGHFMYKEHYGLDDGLFSALKVIFWLSKTGKKLSEFIAPFKKGFYQSGEINLEVKESVKLLKTLEEKYSSGKIDKLDGLTVEYPNWWFNLRASNTEPVVRLNIESTKKEVLEEKTKELSVALRKKLIEETK